MKKKTQSPERRLYIKIQIKLSDLVLNLEVINQEQRWTESGHCFKVTMHRKHIIKSGKKSLFMASHHVTSFYI